jgi:molecular chaperone GrpE
VHIFIGSENKLFSLSGSSLIVAPFEDQQPQGRRRSRRHRPDPPQLCPIIPMVDYTAKLVGPPAHLIFSSSLLDIRHQQTVPPVRDLTRHFASRPGAPHPKRRDNKTHGKYTARSRASDGSPAQPREGAPAAPAQGAQPPGTPTISSPPCAPKRADLKDKLLRAHAEVENIRKRSERREGGHGQIRRLTLLPGTSSTSATTSSAPSTQVPPGAAEQDAALKSFLEGVTMTERELLNVLERYGIKRVQPVGDPFNRTCIRPSWRSSAATCRLAPSCRCSRPASPSRIASCARRMVAVAKGGPKTAQAPDGHRRSRPRPPG